MKHKVSSILYQRQDRSYSFCEGANNNILTTDKMWLCDYSFKISACRLTVSFQCQNVTKQPVFKETVVATKTSAAIVKLIHFRPRYNVS